jgi:hypothetical protein
MCKLLEGDCKIPYIGNNFQITTTSPYSILAVAQVIEGYEAKLCLSCSVDFINDGKTLPRQQIATSKFNVTQQSKCMTTISKS